MDTNKESLPSSNVNMYQLIWCIVVPFIGAVPTAIITKANIKGWYDRDIKKPSWRPPNWAFGPVWTALYTGMGYASYLVWRDGGGFDGKAALPLALYGTQLALNWAWTPLFFGMKKIGPAFFEILGIWGCTAGCIYTFHDINTTASYLMVPYLAWLSLASSLNFWIWRNNPQIKED